MSEPMWRYHNLSVVPNVAPHQPVNTDLIDSGRVWNAKNVLMARYTTDFDCAGPRPWWYSIKDTPVNLDEMKAKKRYRVNVGLKNAEVKKINPAEYGKELYRCFCAAVTSYGDDADSFDEEGFIRRLEKDTCEYYAAFIKETGELAAYSRNRVFDDCVSFHTIKFLPQYMKHEISAALFYTMIYDYINLQGKRYVYDGERSIFHGTNIQNYLESVFDFRKAYCTLHIVYKKPVGTIVRMIYPFRKLIALFKNNSFFAKVNAVLVMEEAVRQQKLCQEAEK